MTDRRTSTLCAIHLVPFFDCPCKERRHDAPLIQVVGCDSCGKHFTLCVCPVPDLHPRGAV